MTDERDEQVVDMESMFQKEVNESAINDATAALLPPKGNYTTNPDDYPLNVTVRVFEERDGSKRRVITLTGRVTTLSEGKEFSAPLMLRLSPDLRNGVVYENDEPTEESTNKPDSASATWVEAFNLYKATRKESPKNEQAVIDFLLEVPFRVYGYHGRNGRMGFKNITGRRGK